MSYHAHGDVALCRDNLIIVKPMSSLILSYISVHMDQGPRAFNAGLRHVACAAVCFQHPTLPVVIATQQAQLLAATPVFAALGARRLRWHGFCIMQAIHFNINVLRLRAIADAAGSSRCNG